MFPPPNTNTRFILDTASNTTTRDCILTTEQLYWLCRDIPKQNVDCVHPPTLTDSRLSQQPLSGPRSLAPMTQPQQGTCGQNSPLQVSDTVKFWLGLSALPKMILSRQRHHYFVFITKVGPPTIHIWLPMTTAAQRKQL